MQWTNTTGQPISFLNVRASIPDSASGGGLTGTLNLYVNGVFRQALNLNSLQTWVYEGNGNYSTSDDQNPADGDPRVFWDESHTSEVLGRPHLRPGHQEHRDAHLPRGHRPLLPRHRHRRHRLARKPVVRIPGLERLTPPSS